MEHSAFYLARPEDLPKNPNELAYGYSELSSLLQDIRTYSSGINHYPLKSIQQIFNHVDISVIFFKKIIDDPNESQQNKDNDNAFNISRVNGNISKIIAHSSLNAYKRLLSEVENTGTNLNKEDWGKLYCAYRIIFDLLSNASRIKYSLSPTDPIKNIDPEKESGIKRWEQGHYVFMTIIQGMIISLNCFKYHLDETKSEESIIHYLHLTTMLMWGSEAALKFAADFSISAYDAEVRPTLAPPIAPPGMSGLYWRDHEFFIKKVFFKLKPIFSEPPIFLSESVNLFREALASVYDAHKLVCTKFVGHTESSLISKKPAGMVLQNYKKNRMHIFNS